MSSNQSLVAELVRQPGLQKQERTLHRGDFLITAGEIERSVYVVNSGAIHAFYVSDQEEHTIRFGYEGSIITTVPSVHDEIASELYLQAIRKTEVTIISKASFAQMMHNTPAIEAVYTKSLEQLVQQQLEREIDLLTSSPIERLNRVMKRSPRLFQEIPSKYIASYLRMTPETLSRIMNS